jgi:hypothetical protein
MAVGMKIQHIRRSADNPRELLGQKSSGGITVERNASILHAWSISQFDIGNSWSVRAIGFHVRGNMCESLNATIRAAANPA